MVDNTSTSNPKSEYDKSGSIPDCLSGLGKTLKLDSNNSIELNKPEKVYFVISGSLEIFSVSKSGQEASGPRSNILQIVPGQLVFGIPCEDGADDITFIGVASERTELLEMAVEDFLERAASADDKGPFASLIEAWVARILESLCLRLSQPPVDFTEIEPGSSRDVSNQTIFSLRQGLRWVECTNGQTSFIGLPELKEFCQNKVLPLTKHCWLAVADGSISCRTTTDIILDDNRRLGILRDFNSLAFRLVRLQRQRTITGQTTKLLQEQDREKRLVESALETLSSSIIKDRREFRDFQGRPLLDACQMVGAHIGIKFVQRLRDGKREEDPIKDICDASRVRVRETRLDGEWWKKDHGSFLGFMSEDDRPVAILCVKTGVYMLGDPQDGSKTRITPELASKLRPVAFVFQVPFPQKALNAWDLLKFSMKGLGPDIWRNIGYGIIAGILALITPIAIGILLDDIIPSENQTQLLGLSAAFIVSAVCMTMFQFVQALSVLRIEGKASFLVQSAVWDRLLSLPVTFFRKFPAGDLANRTLGIDQLRQVISTQAMSTILTAIFSVFQVALLFYYSLELAIVAIVMTIISVIIPIICLTLQLKYQRPLYDLIGKIQAFNLQVINGIAKLRICAAESRMFHRWASMFSRQKELAYKSGVVGNVLIVSTSSLSLTGTFLMFTWTFFSSDKSLQAISPGNFMAFVSAFTSVLGSAFSTLTAIFPMVQAKPIYERTKPILETLPEIKPTAAYPGELSGHIELSKVSFRYNPDGPFIIKNFSLEIMPREFVALVGPSGSGKSTLIRLLLGFEEPESGSILYDGQDLKKLDIKAVRSQIGVVLQNGLLFSGSIFENIAGSSPLSYDEAWAAARMAQLEDDIKEMPMGMNTVIGEGGEGLSGGQRQRLLIARAVVRHPRLLFFDEATSALDNERQELVSHSIEKLEAARLVLAHRLSSIRNAHKICVIVEGQLEELGNYEELMSKKGFFYDLAKRQLV